MLGLTAKIVFVPKYLLSKVKHCDAGDHCIFKRDVKKLCSIFIPPKVILNFFGLLTSLGGLKCQTGDGVGGSEKKIE